MKNLFTGLMAFLLLGAGIGHAQKTFTREELLSGRMPKGFYENLPRITAWQNDDLLIMNTKPHPDSATRGMVMDVKTGKLSPLIKTMVMPEPNVLVYVKKMTFS